jgi:hypothetical protein
VLWDPLVLLHHTLIIIAFTCGVYHAIGTFYMAAFLVNEISTLFLNQNFFFASSPRFHGSIIYKLNGVVLWLTFLICRVAFNAYNLYHMVGFTWYNVAPKYWPTELDAVGKFFVVFLSALAFGHAAINLIWFTKLTQAVMRKLIGKREKKQE